MPGQMSWDGGAGNDFLTGADGTDTFRFTSALSATNIDRITDYSSPTTGSRWTMRFSWGFRSARWGPASSRPTPLGQMQDASDRIAYDTDGGQLYFDRDGSGAAFGRVLFAVVDPGLGLTAGEFAII